jgi:hypothetical protein
LRERHLTQFIIVRGSKTMRYSHLERWDGVAVNIARSGLQLTGNPLETQSSGDTSPARLSADVQRSPEPRLDGQARPRDSSAAHRGDATVSGAAPERDSGAMS